MSPVCHVISILECITWYVQCSLDLRWLMYNWATIVGFHPRPAVCSHGIRCKKEVQKLTLYKILKNIWDEVILCFFSKLFPHYIVVTLNKILATTCKYLQAYLHIVFYFHTISIFFHSVWAQIKHEIFSQKIPIVFHDHWTWKQKSVTVEIWNPRVCISLSVH